MQIAKNAWQFPIAMTLIAAFVLSGCGRNQTSAPSEGAENSPVPSSAKPSELPLDQQIEQKLDPLTTSDVDLYLNVMGTAAERVKNPEPADKATLDRAKKTLSGRLAGRVPTFDDVKTLERANLVAISMDQIVAEEMKVDGRTYRGIVEAVESVVPNPAPAAVPGGATPPNPNHPLSPLEERIRDVNAVNEKFLAPHRDEVQKLISVVRDPANLPR